MKTRKTRLKDELNLIDEPPFPTKWRPDRTPIVDETGMERPRLPACVTYDFEAKEGGVVVELERPENVEVTVVPQASKASTLFKMRAASFVSLLKEGKRPGEAAHALHTTVQRIMENPEARKLVRQTIEEYTLNAEVRKLLTRAVQNKIMVESMADDPKLALEASKEIAKDVEVGITHQKDVVEFEIGDKLKAILEGIEVPTQLPDVVYKELPAAEEVVDAEFEDDK